MKKSELQEKYRLYDEDKTAYGENRSVVQKCKEFSPMWYYRNQLNGKLIPNTPALNRIMDNISDIDWTSNIQEEGLSVGGVTNGLGSFNKSNTMIVTPNRKGSPLHRQSRKGSNPKK